MSAWADAGTQNSTQTITQQNRDSRSFFMGGTAPRQTYSMGFAERLRGDTAKGTTGEVEGRRDAASAGSAPVSTFLQKH